MVACPVFAGHYVYHYDALYFLHDDVFNPASKNIQTYVSRPEDRDNYRSAHTVCRSFYYRLFHGNGHVYLFSENQCQDEACLHRRPVYNCISGTCKAHLYMVCRNNYKLRNNLRTPLGFFCFPAMGILFLLHLLNRRGDGAQSVAG